MQIENRTKMPAKWLAVACLLLLLGVAGWFLRRPKSVAVVHPERVSITETIASSARIGGVQESAVTHDDRLAQEADRILAIDDGRVHEVDKHTHRMKLPSSFSES